MQTPSPPRNLSASANSRHLAFSRRGNRAFTIVEVAMAAGVMAFAISSTIVVLGRGFASLDTARCLSYASQIMQSEMEKMRLTQWGNGTGGAGSGTTGVSAYPTTWTTIPIDVAYTTPGDVGTRMTMQRLSENVHTGMLKITLKITWRPTDGHAELSRTYITYYGQNGLYDFFVL